MADPEKAHSKGPVSGDDVDYTRIYETELQGEFYGSDYYRPPTSDIDSAIIYDDGEDKRATAAFVALNFAPKRVLEAGCAMGLLTKALRGCGVEAEGFDFSSWCIDNAHPQARPWIRCDDVLALKTPADQPYDLVLALDILEHLPPQKVPQAIVNLASALRPGGIFLTVIPAYGPNESGPELYPLRYEEWRRDAALGIPFRNIPLDDRGRPHLGHLTHASIPWWMDKFGRAGLKRLGKVERLLHQRFDASFEYPRRSFFVFVNSGRWAARARGKALCRRIAAVPGLPCGFWEWERWGDGKWVRWTQEKAWEPIEVSGREELRLRAICNHPDIAERPVRVRFEVEGGGETSVDFHDHDWHTVRLELPPRDFAELSIRCSRTWTADPGLPETLQRRLGVGVSFQ